MSPDPLAEALRAFRVEREGSALDTRAIRKRVLQTLQDRRVQRARRVRWLLPWAALFLGSAAFAAVRPQILGALSQAIARLGRASDSRHPSDLSARHRALAAPSVADLAPLPNSSTPAPAPAPAPAPRGPASELALSEPTRRNEAARNRGRSTHAVQGQDLARDLALYGAAHRLHFEGEDTRRALVAWQTYLQAFPRGSLAVEARYNQALCLLRLGRRREAARLLEVFANGAEAGYRQNEARALLDSLPAVDP